MTIQQTQGTLLFEDDFRGGFPRTAAGTEWEQQPIGDLPTGDARTSVTEDGLQVAATGMNPMTGLPAFVATTGQQVDGGQGTRDHVKWTAMPAQRSSHGFPGFDMPENGALTVSATLSAAVHGTDRHPFGPAVADVHSDPRLGCGSLMAADVETFSVFAFLVTNTRIYANYERLRIPGTAYAAYTYAVPLADRMPGRTEELAITVDAGRGTATWSVGGQEALTVERIGYRSVDRAHMLLDHGGQEEALSPRQLTPGLGMFCLLDGALGADGTGLVRLDSTPDHYRDPRLGGSSRQHFLNEAGSASHRLFGQGVELSVRGVRVTAG